MGSPVNANQLLNLQHRELFQSTDRILIVAGGAGAGKSYSIADKLCIKSIHEYDQNYIVLRRSFPSLRSTCMKLIEQRANALGIPYKFHAQAMTATIGRGNTIYYKSANNGDSIERLKSITDVSFEWMEEANEMTLNDWKILYSRLRGGQGRKYSQLAMSLNPVSKYSWIYENFYVREIEPCKKLKYTVLDNPFLCQSDPEYVKQLQRSSEFDKNYYNIYFLGEWGELDGVIFDWGIANRPETYDAVFYGLDFGYANDPTALVKIYRRGDDYWVEEICYQTKMTNSDIIAKMKENNISQNDYIFADCAEPKSIYELQMAGYAVIPCEKGGDSIRFGIDTMKQKKIKIVDGSENILKECRSYIWKKDRDGRALGVPIDRYNHAMDAIRYGITMDLLYAGGGVSVF